MKSLLVCVLVSHGNTRRLADFMAAVLDAEVAEPERVDVGRIGEYGPVGFGSGIYFMAVHPRLWRLVGRLPHVDGIPAVTFFTSGSSELPLAGYSLPIRRRLGSKGFRVLDSFCCRGFDTAGPPGLLGGLNKGRLHDRDLDAAAAFALRLRQRVEPSEAVS